MNKKFIVSLMAIFMVMPLSVNAVETSVLKPDFQDEVDCPEDSDTCTQTIVLSLEALTDYTIDSLDEIEVTMTYVDAEFDKVIAGSDYSKSSSSDTKVTFIPTDDIELEKGDTTILGTFTFTYENAEEVDCSIKLDTVFGTVDASPETPDNSQTGINVPLVALGVAGILATGVYLVVSKKNKIYNI